MNISRDCLRTVAGFFCGVVIMPFLKGVGRVSKEEYQAAKNANDSGGDPVAVVNAMRDKEASYKRYTESAELVPKSESVKLEKVNPEESQRQVSELVVEEAAEDNQLPADISETIQDIITDYMTKFNIEDMSKATAEQWRGACMIVGDYMKQSRTLVDHVATHKSHSISYSTDKIFQLMHLWAILSAAYRKPCLASDLIAFSGVSASYFYDRAGHELTSSGARLREKLMELQESGLSSRLVDGRVNPTGTIFFLKNWHGWKDSREVVHTAETSGGLRAGDLPRLSEIDKS